MNYKSILTEIDLTDPNARKAKVKILKKKELSVEPLTSKLKAKSKSLK